LTVNLFGGTFLNQLINPSRRDLKKTIHLIDKAVGELNKGRVSKPVDLDELHKLIG
jgi:hypothetical protein